MILKSITLGLYPRINKTRLVGGIMRDYKKRFLAFLLILLLILPVTLVFAQEEAVPGPKISPWAVEYIVDGQMTGILGMEHSPEIKDYTKDATTEEIEKFNENFTNKMATNGLETVDLFDKVEVNKDGTRESIVLSIFNVMGLYDQNITSDTEPIDYLIANKIILGNGSEYNLEKKATTEEAITFYVRGIKHLYDLKDLGGKGVFYKIENNGNTVYLFGSIHMADYFMYPIDKERMEAFNNSDELLVELNIQDPEILSKFQMAQLRTDGKKLKDEIGEELYSQYKKVFDQMGIEEKNYEDMEGWAAANQLTILPSLTKYPYGAMLGIDNYFITKAALRGIPVKSLESVDIQIKTLRGFYSGDDNMAKETIKANLEILNSEEKMASSLKETENLFKNWYTGNERAIGELFEKEESSKVLTLERDPVLAEKIKELLNSNDGKTYFVLIGAGHYAPKGSVINILENDGFKVENLNK